MFRLPTHLEELIPPPILQVPESQPWRGIITLPRRSPSARDHHELRCTAAETGGDNKVEQWPQSFVVEIYGHCSLLPQFIEWLKANKTPMCIFMPDRLLDPNAHKANQIAFEHFADMLARNQSVAVLPWNSPSIHGAGIVLFPTGSSRNLLVGAIFFVNLPEFIGSSSFIPRSISYSTTSGHTPYDPAPPNIAASQRHASGSQSRLP